MKVIKGLIKFIFDTIMVLAICLLIFSIGGKTVFNDLLYSNLFKTMIVDETKTVVGNDVSSEEVEKVLDNEETKKLLENFVDTTMNDLGSDEEVDTDIGEEFLEYLKENKDKFEEELGITITDEQIDQVKSSPEYTEAVKKYEETITTSRNSMSEKDIGAIKLYNYIVSDECKYLLIGVIAFCLLVLLLIERPIYGVLKHLSINMLTSGIMVLATSLIVQKIVDKVIQDEQIVFSMSPITTMSIIILVVGVVLLIIYIILNSVLKKPEVKVEEVVQQPENINQSQS